MKSWCCKHAFSVKTKCTLAYCVSCKERKKSRDNETNGRRRGRSKSKDPGGGRVGTHIVCCEKGKCGKHTEADLDDLMDQDVPNNCLKKTRQNNKEKEWENVAENCLGCGKMF